MTDAVSPLHPSPSGPAAIDVTVGPMHRRHLRAVRRIEQLVYPTPWSESMFRTELTMPHDRTYLVARAGERVVGYGGALYVLPDAHITTLAVDPAFQRRGIARRLLAALCRDAVGRGATALTLEVRASNGPAQALYRSFGFAAAGVRTGYYRVGSTTEDAVVMWAHDIDRPAFAERLATLEAS